jgi:hypothetical protein
VTERVALESSSWGVNEYVIVPGLSDERKTIVPKLQNEHGRGRWTATALQRLFRIRVQMLALRAH